MSDIGILGGDLSALPSLGGAANAWASGARALTGTPAATQLGFQRGALTGAQTASALELARERRDKNLALASITPASLSDPGQRAALEAAALRGGINLNELESGLYTRQKATQQQQIADIAANGGSLGDMQARLAALHGEPLKLTAVDGNTIIAPYSLPSEQAAVGGNTPTAVGLGDIAAANARATASYASAGASNARAKRDLAGIGADKASNYDIVTDENGDAVRINKLNPADSQPVMIGGVPLGMQPKGGAGKAGPSLPSPETLKQAFGSDKVGGGANDEANKFFAWQALQAQQDPKFNNGNYALQQYQLRQQTSNTANNQTQADADALGLGDVAANKANATGTIVKTDKGAAIVPGTVMAAPSNAIAQSTLGQVAAAQSAANAPVAIPAGPIGAQVIPSASKFPGAPAIGTRSKGYVYQGGDPSKPDSWTKESSAGGSP
jgi:hypothetical protein